MNRVSGFVMINHNDTHLGVRMVEITDRDSNGVDRSSMLLKVAGGEGHKVGQVLCQRLIQLGFNPRNREKWVEAVLLTRLFQYSNVTNTNAPLIDSFLEHELLQDTESAQATVAIAAAIVPRLLAPNVAWDGGIEMDRFVELQPYGDAAATILVRCYGERAPRVQVLDVG